MALTRGPDAGFGETGVLLLEREVLHSLTGDLSNVLSPI